MIKRLFRAALGCCFLVFSCPLARADSKAIVFAHVNVVPMEGERILADQNVTVVDDKIASIEPAVGAVVPKGAQIIDASGKFLMPGLGEMHAHLPEPSDPPEYMRTTLALFVANGVTTVRCMRGFPNHLAAREDVVSGKLLGPSLFLAGPGLGGDSVTSPEDGVKQVMQQKSEGWDMIKIFPGLTRAEYDAIMTTARRIGMRTGGHVPSEVGLDHALQTGQGTIEHLDGYWEALHFEKPVSEDALSEMAVKTREAGVWNTPTMAIVRFTLCQESLQGALARQQMEYLPQFQVDRWVKLFQEVVCKGHSDPDVSRNVEQNRERLLKKLNDAGAEILFGTDSPNLFEVPGFSGYAELSAMQQIGLSAYDVLLSATRRVGEYLHQNVGTITVGAQADLILLDANPLEDTANVRKRAGVMLRGRWLAHSELQQMLQAIHDLPGNYRVPAAQNSGHTPPPETAGAATNPVCTKSSFPNHDWKQIPREKLEGWSLSDLAAAHKYADSLHDASLMIVECGRLVDEWGDSSEKITTFSVRKSLISAVYGIYAAEGKININDSLEQAGIDDSPSPLTTAERQARIVDLLRARSGVYHAADFETDFQRKIRPARGSHAPGTFWFYNNWDFNVLGTIFEKKTGLKLGDAFYQRIAKPIGMQDFKPSDVYYVGNGEVSEHPAYMFEMTARDMARFGLLYLNRGRWKTQQIVPSDWVEKSTHAAEMVHVGNMNAGGYEYLWWVEYGGVHLGEATLPGMYSAQGAGGHYILVIPNLGMVIVNQFNNEPDGHNPNAVLAAAQNRHAIFDDQFAHLVKLILDARLVGRDARNEVR